MGICIKGGRIIDPLNNTDLIGSLYIENETIVAITSEDNPMQSFPELANFVLEQTIDAKDCIVLPGLVDLKARLREPGSPHKGNIKSETKAAAKAGITSISCPPDTRPCIDTTSICDRIITQAKDAGYANVYPQGALTVNLEGEQLTDMAALTRAGCIGLSNALSNIDNISILRNAYLYAATFNLLIIIQPENTSAYKGCAHEGQVSARLGLQPIPESCETICIAQHLLLIEETGVRAHFSGISSHRAVEQIADAQKRGLAVTADVAMHSLHLTEMDVMDFNPNCHLRPPLRSIQDQTGLIQGLVDGTLIGICSDHQPHEATAKMMPFSESEPGMSALETLLSLGLHLVEQHKLTLQNMIACLTIGPASVLGIEKGSIAPGKVADICIVDPKARWTVTPTSLISQGRNSAFLNWDLPGVVKHTLKNGKTVYPW